MPNFIKNKIVYVYLGKGYNMNPFENEINFYIGEYDLEKRLFEKGVEIYNRRYFLKKEFLAVCLWKSRRPKNRFINNSPESIERLTKKALSTSDEIQKIEYLIQLNGVSIPTASALLSVTDPKNYPIIDIRCVNTLRELGYIDWKYINIKKWLVYLGILRNLAMKYGKPVREVEKGLFAYNRIKLDEDYKNLYS